MHTRVTVALSTCKSAESTLRSWWTLTERLCRLMHKFHVKRGRNWPQTRDNNKRPWKRPTNRAVSFSNRRDGRTSCPVRRQSGPRIFFGGARSFCVDVYLTVWGARRVDEKPWERQRRAQDEDVSEGCSRARRLHHVLYVVVQQQQQRIRQWHRKPQRLRFVEERLRRRRDLVVRTQQFTRRGRGEAGRWSHLRRD